MARHGVCVIQCMSKQTEIQISVVGQNSVADFEALVAIFENVFEMEHHQRPPATYLAELLQRDDFIAVVAKHENKVVGGLTIYLLQQYYSREPLAYLYDLAVATDHQRKGIGRALIDFSRQYCWQRGCEELYVQAEAGDNHAVDFYRSTLPTAQDAVVQFSYRKERESEA